MRIPWKRGAGLAVVAAVVIAIATHRINLAAVQSEAARLNGGVAFALLVILPLVGFPASVAHVAAGLRFGPVRGLALVGVSIGIQLLVCFAVARHWHDRIGGRLARWRGQLPEDAKAGAAVMAVLIPGMPFAVVNYGLPLLGISLRTYLLCCWPLHLLRATITVWLGGESADFTPRRLAVLAGYGLFLLAASSWTYRRLRRRLGDRPPAADGRTRRA